jgi:hypothetical protein
MTGSVILAAAYGLQVKPKDDPFVILSERVNEAVSRVGRAGSYLVDFFPWLRYVPSWFPGTEAKRQSEIDRKYVDEMPRATLKYVKQSMVSSMIGW